MPGKSSEFRISLLNILILMTFVGLLGGLYRARQNYVELEISYQAREAEILEEAARIKAENKKLREEQGVLTIEDPAQIHAIQMREFREKTWTYRVHLPSEKKYYIACKFNNLAPSSEEPTLGTSKPPRNGIKSIRNGIAISMEPGETLITLAMTQGSENEWKYTLQVGSARGGSALRTKEGMWPSDQHFTSSGGVLRSQSSVEKDQPLVLLDLRARKRDDTKSGTTRNSKEGVILWIAPLPEGEENF